MEPKYMRKLAILAKIETTKGTEAAPLAADAILVSDATLTPIEGDEVENNYIKPYFGSSGSTLVTVYSKVSFSIPMAGVAAAGSTPGYAALMRACAASITTQAGVSVTFAPVSSGMESITIYGNIDGVLHKMLGAVGNCKATVDAKGIPKFQFEFTGTFVPATDTTLPAVNYTVFQDPFGVNKTNTTLTLDGVAVACSSFSFDMGNKVVKRDLINVDTQVITDRVSTGSVTFENTTVAVKNWVNLARNSAKVPLVLTHGPNATNVVQINGPLAQVGKPSYSDQDGIQMITLPLKFIPSSTGNDEWSIVVH